MKNYTYLIKNIGLLTISNFTTKLLTFLLVPLYTNVLSTRQYGTYDLFNTTVGVLIPILTLNVQDAAVRFAIDENSNKKAIVTVGFRYMLFSLSMVAFGLFVNASLDISPLIKIYGIYFFLMFLSQALSGFILYYVRGIGYISLLSISSVIASAVTIILNIVFLVFFKWGLVGYFLANVIGPLVQCLYLIYKTGMVKDVTPFVKYKKETHEMTLYSIPLIANSIAWWVTNVSDRYVVVYFCGLAANGIYSVATKIPSILNVFQTIFSQAWTLSAVKDFDSEDKKHFFENTYKAYNCFLTLVCSGIIVTDKLLARYIYAKSFYSAWKFVPWLTIAILFGALAGYVGGVFTAVKDSKIFAHSTVVGAVTNLILNFIFTPFVGPLGSSIATVVSYVQIWGIRLRHSKKYISFKINLIRDLFTYIILLVQSILLLMDSDNLMYIIEIIFFGIIVITYIKDIKTLLLGIIKKTRG